MSKEKKMETWVIQHKDTGEYFKARSGKNSWKNKAAAKNAWAYNWKTSFYYDDDDVRAACEKAKVEPVNVTKKYYSSNQSIDFPYFDDQDSWALVNLLDKKLEDSGKAVKELQRAKELLWEAYAHLESPTLVSEIKEFLDSTKEK